MPVVDYEGLYEVSSKGRVRSLGRVVQRSDGRSQRINARLMKLKEHKGYYYVDLSSGGIVRRFGVHQLVCTVFNGLPPSFIRKPETRHFNGNKIDNAPTNLLWGSSSDNKFDSVRQGVHFPARETECKYGHTYSESNILLKVKSDGGHERVCLPCRTRRSREWKDKIRNPNYQHRDKICKRGHRRTIENTLISNGRRRCRDCRREYLREYRKAKINGTRYSRSVPQRYGAVDA